MAKKKSARFKNHSESRSIVYQSLPRFVTDLSVSSEEGMVSDSAPLEIVRQFEWEGEEYTLGINPALVGGFVPGGKYCSGKIGYRYPGVFEEIMEKALRQLAVSTNEQYNSSDKELHCNLEQLGYELLRISGDKKVERKALELSLEVFALTKYFITNGSRSFYFRAVEELDWSVESGEIFYWIRFSSIFFR